MPKEQEEFRDAVEAVLRVVIFENWLRFYFIVGKGEDERLFLEIPEKSMNNRLPDVPKSRLRICSCPP